MNLVKVVIPIYQASLSQQERKSLSQAYKILRMYPLVVIKPNHLDLSELVTEFPKLSFISFADSYFKGISGYNRLMLAKEFYESFLDCTYILIYQLDAYVFRDELREWCNKGYDYIGAPWLQRPVYKLPVISGIMHLIHSYHKFRGKPSKQDLYGKIGKTLTCNIGSYYYFLREIISPSLIRDAKEIPIIINNFNRLTTLRLLTETLTACGYTNIYILDNASTYPPLLEYYKTCPFTVFHLNQNLGFKALWKSPLKKRFCNDYYIYTDSDVIPSDYCPKDFIDYFFKELKKHPFARKIGFSLRIDNIPDSYIHKEEVINLEKQYYLKPAEGGLYRAPIDTTFALYRPRVGLSRSRSVEAYRTAYPYQAEHLPWYNDSSNLSEEEQYYISHCTHITEWSSKSKLDTKTQS